VQQEPNIPSINASGFRVATRTHIGLRRKRNEDFLGVESTMHGLLLVVCDGMGGHAGGDRASRLAVELLSDHVRNARAGAEHMFRAGVELANQRISSESRTIEDAHGMGTTLVAAIAGGNRATVVNVGDSRAYLFHDGRLRRVTIDHSVVGELVASGELTEEQAAHHPQRNLITRALGTTSHVEPDIFNVTLEQDDILLLSTDGLHGLVRDAEIEELLRSNPSPERACDALIEAALAAGGTDNVTVALLRVGNESDDGGPITDPATLPPATTSPQRGPSRPRLVLLLIAIVGLAGILMWGLQQFGVIGSADGRDSVTVIAPDSIIMEDSLTTIDSLGAGDTLRFGADTLLQALPGDDVTRSGTQQPPNDLSGRFGSSKPDTVKQPSPGRRQGQR
jgi:PPM family protein phosphatase